MLRQQIAAAVVVVADADGVGKLMIRAMEKDEREPPLLQLPVKLRVRIWQRGLAALGQNARRGIKQELLKDFVLAPDGVFRRVDLYGEALRSKAGLDILEKRREDIVAERGCDHGDAPVLRARRRTQVASASAPLFDQSVLLQDGQRLPHRLAADMILRRKLLLTRKPKLPARVLLRQRLPQRLHQLQIFGRHAIQPPLCRLFIVPYRHGKVTAGFVRFLSKSRKADGEKFRPVRTDCKICLTFFGSFSYRKRKFQT